MAFMFKDLRVYQKSIELYDNLSELTKDLPKGTYHISDQLNRAALSISLNIAEGNGRYHKKDRTQFFKISRGSVFECVAVLDVCLVKKYIEKEKYDRFVSDLDVVARMLTKLAYPVNPASV